MIFSLSGVYLHFIFNELILYSYIYIRLIFSDLIIYFIDSKFTKLLNIFSLLGVYLQFIFPNLSIYNYFIHFIFNK